MHILTTSHYDKKLKKVTADMRERVLERLALFMVDQRSPLLNDHKLSGARKNQRSINITGDWRLIYEQYNEETVRLIDIDTHSNLYGK